MSQYNSEWDEKHLLSLSCRDPFTRECPRSDEFTKKWEQKIPGGLIPGAQVFNSPPVLNMMVFLLLVPDKPLILVPITSSDAKTKSGIVCSYLNPLPNRILYFSRRSRHFSLFFFHFSLLNVSLDSCNWRLQKRTVLEKKKWGNVTWFRFWI